MKTLVRDGGPVFPGKVMLPSPFEGDDRLVEATSTGLSIRDWFAGLAMQGMYAGQVGTTDGDVGGYARAAYQIADAMLAQRGRREEPVPVVAVTSAVVASAPDTPVRVVASTPAPTPAVEARQPVAMRASARDQILEYLKTHTRVMGTVIEHALGLGTGERKRTLDQLAREGRVTFVGNGRGIRWSLATSSAPAGPKPVVPHHNPIDDPLWEAAQGEAARKARQFGHDLGPWKSSSPGAGSELIARCVGCDTYVTLDRALKASGPGIRHECMATKVSRG